MAVTIPFRRDLEFDYGTAAVLSPLVRRVVAHNPSPFTFHGTGTYIVGHGRVAVIDPGPALPEHVDALLAALQGETVSHILITHTHSDHSPAAAALKAGTGAKTYGFGPHPTQHRGPHVEEDGDYGFSPDVTLSDGEAVQGDGWTVQALHTPGHISNHLCFALHEERALFSGDHVMGWSTTVVSPPDGDMHAYMTNLRRLLDRDETIYYPTHGAPILDPKPFVAALIEHREERERQIVACIRSGVGAIPEMVEAMYQAVPRHLHRAAARSVLAHLIHMQKTGRVTTDGPATETAQYRLPG